MFFKKEWEKQCLILQCIVTVVIYVNFLYFWGYFTNVKYFYYILFKVNCLSKVKEGLGKKKRMYFTKEKIHIYVYMFRF